MSSYAAITPEIPAPTMATSAPRCSSGIEPSPAGCVIQSSKGNGKSGPNIVTGRIVPSAAEGDSFAMLTVLHRLGQNGTFYSRLTANHMLRSRHLDHGELLRASLLRGGRKPCEYKATSCPAARAATAVPSTSSTASRGAGQSRRPYGLEDPAVRFRRRGAIVHEAQKSGRGSQGKNTALPADSAQGRRP